MEQHPFSGQRVHVIIVDISPGTTPNGKPKLPVAKMGNFTLFIENPPPYLKVGNELDVVVTRLLAKCGFCKVVQDGR